MRIAIDIRPLQTASAMRGVGVYTEQIVRSLLRIDDHNEYLLLASSGGGLPDLPPEIRGKIVHLKRPVRGITVWDQLFSYSALKKMKIDVFHSPFYALPLVAPKTVGCVQTIHDLTPIIFRGSVSPKNRMIFSINFNLARKADRIIAVSGSTRNDIVRILGIPGEKIAVIHNGIDHLPDLRPREIPSDMGANQEKDRYILYVGGFDRTKNVPVLIRAFSAISKKYSRTRLMLVGADCGRFMTFMKRHGGMGSKPGRKSREFVHLCENLLRSGRIILKGYVGPDELASCYREADLFVFPSLYEGFGLPPLEAMRAGIPVLAAGRGSLPEVLGDAAILANPEDADEMAAQIDRILSDDALRERMKSAGMKRADEFRWERSARLTLDLYRSLHREKQNGRIVGKERG